MANQFTHTGKDPPALKLKSKINMNPSSLKVLPPDSPVIPDLVPRFDALECHDSYMGTQHPIEDQFVDLNLTNRDHVTTTTHISCTQSTEGIPNPLPNVVPSGLMFCSYDQSSQQDQTPFYSLPQPRQKTPADKTFEDGPSLKQFDATSFEDDTTFKKSPPVPACLYVVPEGPKQLYTQEPIKLKKTFEEGKVVLGTTEALRDLVQRIGKLGKTTGVICNEDLNPDGDQYEKDAHYIVEKPLGQGSFGTVNLAIDSNRRKKFVLKKVSKDSFAKNEVMVPSMLNQENITRLYGLIHQVGPEGEYMQLLIEDAGMALNKYRAQYPNMARREDVVWDFCKQGFRALEHMAKFGIIHQDIKPENVCLTDHGDGFVNMKITDFGSARFAQDPMHFVGLTPEYLSPEVCKLVLQMRHKVDMGLADDDITGKSDMFAFALVVMFMYKGYHILQHVITNGQSSYEAFTSEQRQHMHMMLIVQVAQGENFVKNFIPDDCSRDMRVLLHKMLEINPVERLSAREALKSIEGLDQQMANDRQRLERMRVKHAMFKLEMPSLVVDQAGHGFVPEIAEELIKSDHGPVKSATKDRLRKMMADPPYNRGGKGITDPYARGAKGSGKGRTATVTSVMTPRHVASKKMPMSPMADFKEIVGVTERNAPIAQPSADNDCAMDMAASPMIDIRKRPKPAAPQFVYQQPRRPVQRTTSDAMQVDCGQMDCARTTQQSQVTEAQWQTTNQAALRQWTEMLHGRQVTGTVLEQMKKMLKDNQQSEMFMQNVRRAGNTTETELNGPLDPSQVPRFDKIFF